jgi:hypothetical protein
MQWLVENTSLDVADLDLSVIAHRPERHKDLEFLLLR